VKLCVVVDRKGKPFMSNPEYHCSCFRKNPKLHYSLIDQLKPSDIKSVISLKPLRSKNVLEIADVKTGDDMKDVYEEDIDSNQTRL